MTGATLNISAGGYGQNQPSLLQRMPVVLSNPGMQQGLNQDPTPPLVGLKSDRNADNYPLLAPLAVPGLVPPAIDVSCISGSSVNSSTTPLFVPEITSYHRLGQ